MTKGYEQDLIKMALDDLGKEAAGEERRIKAVLPGQEHGFQYTWPDVGSILNGLLQLALQEA